MTTVTRTILYSGSFEFSLELMTSMIFEFSTTSTASLRRYGQPASDFHARSFHSTIIPRRECIQRRSAESRRRESKQSRKAYGRSLTSS